MATRTVTSVSVDLEAKTANFKDDLKKAGRSLRNFEKNGKKAFAGSSRHAKGFKVTVDQVTNSLGPLKAALASVTAAIGFSEIVKANVEYQKLKASLETVTGSANAADDAFSNLRKFATETPFQLNQVVEAFIKLKAMGLEPSQEALASYGNTAAAMGRSLNQMIEAVADAAVGEFERLKEFGIKARSEGDRVKFTFQGVTTEIGKNAEEIQDYLLSIGNIEFAGAMEKQMNTLGGAFSNLQDSTFNLAVAIGEAGLNDLVMDFAKATNEAAQAVTKFVDNPASMPNWLKNLSYWIYTASKEITDLGNWIKSVSEIIKKATDFDIQGIKRTVAERKLARAEMEADLAEFALKLQTDIVPKVQDAYAKMFKQPEQGPIGNSGLDRMALSPVMTGEEFEAEFARAEAQFDSLNELYATKAQERHETEFERMMVFAMESERAHLESQKRTLEIEKKYSDMMIAMKFNVASQSLGFIKLVAGEHEAVAKLIIIAEKGLAIAQTKINTEVAAMRALAELGPIAGSAMAGKIRTMGAISMGLIAATGLAQAAGIGGGGGTGIGGVPAIDTAAGAPLPPPTFTDNTQTDAGTRGTINIVVNGVITEDILNDLMIPAIQDAVNERDVILINNDSRQALEFG